MKKLLLIICAILFTVTGLHSQSMTISESFSPKKTQSLYKKTVNYANIVISSGVVNGCMPRNSVDFKSVNGKISWSNNLKGDAGEAIVNKVLLQNTVDGRQKWTIVTPRNKPQGLDHVAVRWRNGKPIQVLIAETKVNTSKLKTTKNGPQMSDSWIKPHLENLAKEYSIAGNADNIKINSKIPEKAQICDTHIENPKTGQMEKLWSIDGGKTWNYTGKESDIALAKEQCKLQGEVFRATADGKISDRRRLFNVDLKNGKIVISDLDANGMKTQTSRSVDLNVKEYSTELRAKYKEYLIDNGCSEGEAKLLSKFAKIEDIANGNISPTRLRTLDALYRMPMAFAASFIAAGTDLLIQVILNGGFKNVNWKEVGIAAGTGFGFEVVCIIANCFKMVLLEKLMPVIGAVVSICFIVRDFINGVSNLKGMILQIGVVVVSTGLFILAAKIGANVGAKIGSGICPIIGTVVGAVVGVVVGVVVGYFANRIQIKWQQEELVEFVSNLSSKYSLATQTMQRKYYNYY